jgi:hypothetical protein
VAAKELFNALVGVTDPAPLLPETARALRRAPPLAHARRAAGLALALLTPL